MKKAITVLAALFALLPVLAVASAGSYDAGHASGYQVGAHLGQFIRQFGPYAGLLAFMVAIWRIHSRRGRAAPIPGGDV